MAGRPQWVLDVYENKREMCILKACERPTPSLGAVTVADEKWLQWVCGEAVGLSADVVRDKARRLL
jgi:hypothetical protein